MNICRASSLSFLVLVSVLFLVLVLVLFLVLVLVLVLVVLFAGFCFVSFDFALLCRILLRLI